MINFNKLKIAVGALLADEELPTQEKIREYIDMFRAQLTNREADELVRHFEAVHGVRMRDAAVLQEAEFEPWLGNARSSIDPYYWDRYKKFLANKEFSARVLATLDRDTDQILGHLENPKKDGAWDRRGMVMGHVQSGKTANYAGLICKAADAGYRVIIIIAGIHNNLRNQTQRRIDEGFIGFDSIAILKRERRNSQGVGRFNSRRSPAVFTTSRQDFKRTTADSVHLPLKNLSEPAVFVIKKNYKILKNLIEWLTAHNAQQGTDKVWEPMLLIDDEADNASINISSDPERVSRINGQIRKLLSLFGRSGYVGYTATPFANIFIDPDNDDEMLGDDLFPRDFIVSLDPPTNYFGATKVFMEDSERFVLPIDDYADLLPLKHRIHHQVTGLPDSLETAVRTFIVACAIRKVRGQVASHNSMLVNVSRFVNVQAQIRNAIHELVARIRSSVRINGGLPTDAAMSDPEVAALKRAFEALYATECEVSWQDIQKNLHDSVSPIKVIEVNSRASDPLDYAEHKKDGLNVIAVGGLSLSRGLTLEGLVVSYFLRNSMMYDTLLQMGRWFGYRNGYEKLCRVWMPEEAQGWYAHITEAIEELRGELAYMKSVNATPKDFGLRVRSHPETLVVTARNKMGAGQQIRVRVGLANCFVETAILRRDPPSLAANRNAAISLAANLRRNGFPPEQWEQRKGALLVLGVPASAVMQFLAAFRNHEGSIQTQPEPILQYIRERQTDELARWDILFPGLGKPSPKSLIDSSLGFKIVCQRRGAGLRSAAKTLMITNKQRVSSRGIEKTGLTSEEIKNAEADYQRGRNPVPRNFPDWIYRRRRKKPLLIVHLLAIGKKEDNLSGEKPVVAWSISFPRTDREEAKVEYVVNTRWYKEHYGDEDDEEAEGNDY